VAPIRSLRLASRSSCGTITCFAPTGTGETRMATTAAKTRATRIIALTDRAPVKIFVDEWTRIAEARGDSFRGSDYGRHMQSLDQGELNIYTLEVLQHRDGRTLVSATLVARDGDNERRGELLRQGAEIPAAIRRVGEDCELPDRIIRACVDALPPEDLDMPAPAPQAP
jgi:hypothetical protein